MKGSVVLLIVIFTLGVVRASAQDVRYDYDKDKDLSKYKTYKWLPIKGAFLGHFKKPSPLVLIRQFSNQSRSLRRLCSQVSFSYLEKNVGLNKAVQRGAYSATAQKDSWIIPRNPACAG